MTLSPGASVGGRYNLVSLIATGGMGQVWRAEDTTLHRLVAVKVLRSEFTGDPTFLARFRAEARNTAALSHPNIASIYDYGEAGYGDQPGEHIAYLVIELVDGQPLSEILTREGRLSPERTLDILGQAGAGLNAAHRAGVVHRDVKPGNLLVRPDGTVKITDFGIARAASNVPLTRTGMVVGTAHYLSPEQAEGRVTTPASDVYSLGVVGYECLAGRRPFDGDTSIAVALKQIRENPPPLPPDVPAPMRELIGRAMAKDPALRFPTGGEFAAAIAAVRAGRQIAPLPTLGPAILSGVPTQILDAGAGAAALGAGAAGAGALGAAGAGQTRVLAPGEPPGPWRPAPPPVAPEPPRRRTGMWILLVLALLVLAGVIGLIVAQNLSSSPGGTDPTNTGAPVSRTTAPTPTPTTEPTPTTTAQTSSTTATTTQQTTPSTTPSTTASTTTTTTQPTTTQPTTTQPSTTSAPPTTVTVDPAAYVGRPVDEVTADLQSMGLQTRTKEVKTDDVPADTVVLIDPSGEVPAGSTITVTYAVPRGPGGG